MKARRSGMVMVLALVAVVGTARSDITVKSTLTSKGLVGLTNMEGTQTQMIAGDMAKTLSNLRMTSKVMKMLGAGKPQETGEITRIDKELFWDLDFKKTEYAERTFAEVRAEMEKGLKDAEKEKAKYEKEHARDAEKLRTEFKVERTGKSQKVAGHNTDEVILTMLVYGKNSESGESGAMKVTMDLWMAKDVPGAEEFQRFYSALAAKLGFTGHNQQSMEGMLKAFGVDSRELYKHTKDLQGMALKSTMTLAGEGQGSGRSGGSQEVKKDQGQEQPEGAGKLDMAKKLGGFLGKKKDKEAKSEEPAKEAGPSGPPNLMEFSMTVTEIISGGIPASEFEVPAGFSKK